MIEPYPPYQPQPPMRVAPKSPALAVFLSFLLPGLGSMTSGAGGIGALILTCYVVSWVFALFLVGIPFLIGTWVWGMIHAYGAAQKWNASHGIVS